MIFDDLNCNVFYDEPLKRHTTFGIGGNCIALIEVESVEDIILSLKLIKKNNLKFFILGNGSNILVPDEGYNGVIIKLHKKFSDIIVDNEDLIINAGAKNSDIFNVCLENSLTGYEFASGIPGTIGGAIFMNAGAYGGEIKNIIKYVEALNINTYKSEKFLIDDCKFSYRSSIFQKNKYIILNACVKLNKGKYENIKNIYLDLKNKRNLKQPLSLKSGGSTFKRPNGFYASKLIEDCNLKGYSINDAEVSTKHAGFVVNKGNATFKDVINLVNYIKEVVYKKYKVNLEMEVRVLED